MLKLLDEYSRNNPHNQVYFDAVEYMQTKNIEKPLSKIEFDPPLAKGTSIATMEFKERLLLLKRKAFAYENEYRAIIVKPKATKENGIIVEFEKYFPLISSITVGPRFGPDTYAMLKEVLHNKYGFDGKNIKQSNLYKSIPSSVTIAR